MRASISSAYHGVRLNDEFSPHCALHLLKQRAHLSLVADAQRFNAMILSAGYGTRLAPLTSEVPKPLVPLGQVPLLGLNLEKLHEHGAQTLVVNVHHHGDEIAKYIKLLPFNVHVVHEVSILGTAGGIAGARPLLTGAPTVVVNGDIVGELPVAQLLRKATSGLTLALVPRPLGSGTVGVGDDGRVVRLRGESFGQEESSGDYMGVAAIGEDCLSSLPDEGCLVGDWALPHLRAGGRITTVTVETDFEDIGDPSAYLQANLRWLSRASSELLDNGSSIGQGAQVESGVTLVNSVLGKSCRVTGLGEVKDCVLLPGASLEAPKANCIVTPGGVVMQVETLASPSTDCIAPE